MIELFEINLYRRIHKQYFLQSSDDGRSFDNFNVFRCVSLDVGWTTTTGRPGKLMRASRRTDGFQARCFCHQGRRVLLSIGGFGGATAAGLAGNAAAVVLRPERAEDGQEKVGAVH